MRPSSRDRISIELRGMRERLHCLASTRKTTASALARQALVSLLDDESGNKDHGTREATTSCGDPVVKLTLRLSAAHAVALATRARAADVSQGAFVAALIDGSPPAPPSRDHADLVAAVMASTDQLAVVCTDINALMRLAKIGAKEEIQSYRARVWNLVDDVRSHLAVAAPLVAALKSVRRMPARLPGRAAWQACKPHPATAPNIASTWPAPACRPIPKTAPSPANRRGSRPAFTPVKGSLRRASPALDSALQTYCGGRTVRPQKLRVITACHFAARSLQKLSSSHLMKSPVR